MFTALAGGAGGVGAGAAAGAGAGGAKDGVHSAAAALGLKAGATALMAGLGAGVGATGGGSTGGAVKVPSFSCESSGSREEQLSMRAMAAWATRLLSRWRRGPTCSRMHSAMKGRRSIPKLLFQALLPRLPNLSFTAPSMRGNKRWRPWKLRSSPPCSAMIAFISATRIAVTPSVVTPWTTETRNVHRTAWLSVESDGEGGS